MPRLFSALSLHSASDHGGEDVQLRFTSFGLLRADYDLELDALVFTYSGLNRLVTVGNLGYNTAFGKVDLRVRNAADNVDYRLLDKGA